MADYVSAQISIGGRVAREAVAGLCQAICDQGLALGWCEAPFQPASDKESLAARKEVAGALVLSLCADEVAWGVFPELEAFLEEQGISYDRFHEAKYEIEATVKQFRPGRGAVEFSSTLSQVIVVPAAPVWRAMAEVRQAIVDLGSGRITPVRESLQATLSQLETQLPQQLPPLETFEIAE
jgi:hypothetical protein